MVSVGPLGLKLPRDLGTGQPSRQEDLAVARPARQIRAAAVILLIPIRGAKPHDLCLGEQMILGSVRTGDAKVAPIVTGVGFEVAILIEDPLPVR